MNYDSNQQKNVSLPPSPKGRGLLYGLVTLGLLGVSQSLDATGRDDNVIISRYSGDWVKYRNRRLGE